MSDRRRPPEGGASGAGPPRPPDSQNQAPVGPDPPEEPDLLRDVAGLLDEDGPLGLLGMVSTLLASLEPDPFAPEPDEELPTVEYLADTFGEVDRRATTALLTTVAALVDDDLLCRRIRRVLAGRDHALPAWLDGLDRAEPDPRALVMTDDFGDGENVLVGVGLPGGHHLTAVVYIDHNLGTLVKDAFVVEQSVSEVADSLHRAAAENDDGAHILARDLGPADARARVTEAVDLGRHIVPPIETDTWPSARPLVEWVVGMLPAGGTGYVRPEWSEHDLAVLTERFFASPPGTPFDDAEHRQLFESLMWFGTDYGPGEPLRWSPTAVELLLTDWLPRKVVADVEFLDRAPDLLRALIRFSHAERGLAPELTRRTLAAVDEYEPEYRETIRNPRPQGPQGLLTAMGLGDGGLDGLDGLGGLAGLLGTDGLPSLRGVMRHRLGAVVGGAEALDRLDTTPLPDEPFDLSAVPEDVLERVEEVRALVDRCSTEFFDVEFRTACRRLLARAAANDPAIFRRRSRADTSAAAIGWIVGRANDLLGPHAEVTVKDLAAFLGVSSGALSQRSKPFLAAIGVDEHGGYGPPELGSPEYLVSAHRAELIEVRDREY